MEKEGCLAHFWSSPKSIKNLYHFINEAQYVESLSEWRNLRNVPLTNLEKRPILIDLKGAFKDEFSKKRNKNKNGKKAPRALIQGQTARSRQRVKIAILGPSKTNIKGEELAVEDNEKQRTKGETIEREKHEAIEKNWQL